VKAREKDIAQALTKRVDVLLALDVFRMILVSCEWCRRSMEEL